jgi:hypothetical protein
MVEAGHTGPDPPTVKDSMMITPTAKKWFGAVVAALAFTMVTSVAPAHAAPKSDDGSTKVVQTKRDSGWNLP